MPGPIGILKMVCSRAFASSSDRRPRGAMRRLIAGLAGAAAGTVVAILAENGEPVEFGQPLFIIE